VLDGLDLDVMPGSRWSSSEVGQGKSVLLKHIIGLLFPDAGTVEVDGKQPARLGNRQITEFRRKFGMSFQEGALFDSMTVRQNVAFPLQRLTRLTRLRSWSGWTPAWRWCTWRGTRAEKMPAQLSGGCAAASASPAPSPTSRRSSSSTSPPPASTR
jgi:phospholipid/cholesterol/gamma-HCH transport system ATP-binding protein